MKILLITGQLAKDYVRKHALESHVKFDVLALPIPVAALMTSRYVAQELKGKEIKGYDMILVPGMIFGDLSLIEQTLGVPTFKGPRYAADLPVILDSLEKIKLSKTFPACSLFKEELRRVALNEIASVERNRDMLLRNPGNILIGNLAVGRDFPIRVMAEIIDAPLKSDEEIRKRAVYYVNSGADIVDIGMIAGESKPADAERAVKAVKSALNIPVSIDTINPDEAESGVSAGADIVLSVDGGNVEEMARFASKVAVVVIPTDHRKSYFPKKVEDRIQIMEENMAGARRLGMNKILADLILDSLIVPGAMESLAAFSEFRRRNMDVPMFCGVGNVTELMDADSVGVNAFIAGVAAEVGINILLTTEVSDKARGSVKELATASRMMFLAKKRDSIPKGLGVDLLLFKERKNVEEAYDPKIEKNLTVVEEEKFDDYIVDIGMIAGESKPADAERAVKAVKSALNIPVSIDTINPDEAESGVSAGADIVLSVDGGNVEEMARFASKVAVVVIPTDHRKSYFPKKVEDRIQIMEENMAGARRLGMNKILADLILDSLIVPGAMESLAAFSEFRRRNMDVPMFCGVGNVTELMDADSVGVNAFIAGVAAEVGINILLTTEASHKVRGSVKELATASRMMFLAKKRDSIPKGLGIDLLLFKERKNVEEPYDPKIEKNLTVVEEEKFDDYIVDPKGCFKVMLDRENEKIVVIHYGGSRPKEPNVIVKGKNASALYRTIAQMNLMSSLDHAAYLGYELGKAEVALKIRRSYIQDNELFDRNSQ